MFRRIAVVTALVSLLAFAVPMCASAADVDVALRVSPQTLYLDSAVTWVTIHVPVSYTSVTEYWVTIDGEYVPVAWDKADLLGNLVIKLSTDDVAAMVEPGVVELAVEGSLSSEETFRGAVDYVIRDGPYQKNR